MNHLMFIPWFRLEAWEIPFPLIGVLKLQPFGLLVAIGILIGSRVAEWRGEQTGVPRQLVSDFLVYTIGIGLVSAYVLNLVVYEPAELIAMVTGQTKLHYTGLSSFGGFFGGVGAAIYFRQKKHASIMVLGDIWCFAFPVAWLFGRTGCFTVHDHPGLATDFFLAVDNYYERGLPRHDLGLYEVIWSAAVIPLLFWLAKKPRPRGYFMALVPILYAPVRFGLDFLRETPINNGDVRYFGLTPGHYASVVTLIAGLLVLARIRRGPDPEVFLGHAPPPEYAEAMAPSPGSSTPPKAKPAAKAKRK